MLLPFIALGQAFEERSWARVWNDLRLRLLGNAFKFALPAWSEQSGQFLPRPMTAAEGTMWLRDIVVKGYGSGDTVTTHEWLMHCLCICMQCLKLRLCQTVVMIGAVQFHCFVFIISIVHCSIP